MSNFGNKVKFFFKNFGKPSNGNSVSNKEILLFSAGGVGMKTVSSMASYIQMTPTCLLMGSIYGLSPSQLMLLFIISTLVSIIKTPLASWLVDNTNTKYGKFRPYILWAGIPNVIGVLGLCFLVPPEGSAVVKMVIIGIFFNVFTIGQQLYMNAYMGLSQVLTPNSSERGKIMSLSELVGNFGPSVVNFLLPVFAQLFFGDEGLLNLTAYRILLPTFCILGFLIGLIALFFTKERVIIAKDKKTKVKFIEGLKIVGKNRDFWIVTVSKFFSGFRMGISFLVGWICLYQLLNSGMNGVLTTVMAIAFVPGMLLAPILMKKLGSGMSAFLSFILNAVTALLMLFTFKKGVAFFFIMLFLYNFASGPQYIMQTSITADALDEIQLKENRRVEGFAQNFQQIFETIGGVVAQLIFMVIYESFGLKAGESGITDYNLLKDPAIREPIVSCVIIVAIVASVLSALPFLFSKMNHAYHESIIAELERRKADEEDIKINIKEE